MDKKIKCGLILGAAAVAYLVYRNWSKKIKQQIEEQERQEKQLQAPMAMGANGAPSSLEASAPPRENGEVSATPAEKQEIPNGAGYSTLQRRIAQGEDVV